MRRGPSTPPRATGYRARPYNISRGLPDWQSRDPSGEKAGINLYEYCLDTPVRRIDPLGLDCKDCKGKPTTGAGDGEKCCGNEGPMSNTAPNPYPPSIRYSGFSAQYMFTNGGNGPWGNLVRSCLVCMFSHGANEDDAHAFCYQNASQRLPWYDTVEGYGAAILAASQQPLSLSAQ